MGFAWPLQNKKYIRNKLLKEVLELRKWMKNSASLWLFDLFDSGPVNNQRQNIFYRKSEVHGKSISIWAWLLYSLWHEFMQLLMQKYYLWCWVQRGIPRAHFSLSFHWNPLCVCLPLCADAEVGCDLLGSPGPGWCWRVSGWRAMWRRSNLLQRPRKRLWMLPIWSGRQGCMHLHMLHYNLSWNTLTKRWVERKSTQQFLFCSS